MFDTDAAKAGPDCGATPVRRTLSCFLCGGAHIYPGPRFENHLMNEHGAVFDLDFIVKISLFKQEHGYLPSLDVQAPLNGHSSPNKDKVSTNEMEAQTESDLTGDIPCSKCKEHSTLGQVNGLKPTNTNIPKQKVREEANFHSLRISNVSSLDESNPMDEDDFHNEDDDLNEDEEEPDDDLSTHGFMGVDPKDFLGNQLIHEDESQFGGLSPLQDDESLVTCWQCPECAKLYQRHSSFKQHACAAHDMTQDDIMSVVAIQLPEEDFKQKQAELQDRPSTSTPKTPSSSFIINGGVRLASQNGPPIKTFPLDKSKRKPIGKEWAPNSFSSTFTCFFCNEQFRKDYKLKLHLMLNHKSESPKDMAKAKEELTKSKLDGCVHKCALCGSKYNSVANFTRHIKDVHNMSRAMYREDYGSSEVVSRMFKCELCEKEVKHTRNIIGAHMKMVHLISWREYQEILVKIRQGESVGDLPAPELFDCVICGVSVKYKREHLNKKHQITEDVYDELILKKSRGEDISDSLPTRELVRCLICDRECLDFKKHIERSHQITGDMYEEIITSRGLEDQRRSISQFEETLVTTGKGKANGNSKSNYRSGKKGALESPLGSLRSDSPNGISSSANGSHLSTDLQCYFGCDEVFKKDYQLYLHLKLKHRHETPDEIARAYEAADEEIALTKRSGSVFQCALCPKQFNDNGAFYSHIQSKHDMQWRDYKIRHGRCEVESSPFECKICSRVIKYDRNTIHTHLKNVHGINWTIYLDRLRKMRRGERPDDLPQIEMIECRVCNVQVKYLKDHLKNAHKITEQEYESLFEGEHDLFSNNNGQTVNEPQVSQPLSAQPISSNGLNLLPSQPVAIPKPPKSDIQNKTNKNCSSCNITFETRRSFIEHCTTVHSMKFKTKSGITISAPTLQQNLKRKLEIQNGIEHLASRQEDNKMVSKRPKSSNLLEEDMASNQGTQYTPNGVSKWNQCVYQCCFCGKSTQSRSSMTSHIHNSHGIPIKDYKEKNYPDIEVETRWFQCRLCTARTKFVKDCIAPHLKMSHNMEIEYYEKNYMKTEDWPSKTSPVSSLKSENKLVCVSPTSPPQKAAKSVSSPSNASSSNGSHKSVSVSSVLNSNKADKWNRCKFKCAICAWVNVDSRQMRAHIATKHHMNYEKYVRSHGTAETVTMKFRCDLCHSEMKHCRQNIYAHMKDVHKITLDEYEDRIGGYDSSYAQEVSAADSHAFDSPFFNQPEILVDNGNQPSRWNKCRFQCALCQKLSSEKRHIRDHIVKAHGMAMTDYEGTYGDCEIHTEYFFCAVCHTEVKHNLKNISLHLQNVHSLSPQDYEDKYGRISDEEIVPAVVPVEVNEEQLGGFGSHFLLEENGSSADETSQQTKAKRSRPSAKIPGGLPCDYCGKVFSNRSNCNRHMILSCEARKVNPDGSTLITTDKNGEQMEYNDDDGEEEEEQQDHLDEVKNSPEHSNDLSEKCPYPDCDETYARSALLKRHLFEAHNIQNISVQLPDLENEKRHFDRIKSEPKDLDEDRKVPPLRVKLSSGIASPTPGSSDEKTLTPSSTSRSTLKEAQSCQHCSYKNSNLYILGRHQRACLKRQRSSSDMENDEEQKIQADPIQPVSAKLEESQNLEVNDEQNKSTVNPQKIAVLSQQQKSSEREEQDYEEKNVLNTKALEPSEATRKGLTCSEEVPVVGDHLSGTEESLQDSEVETSSQTSQSTASTTADEDGSQEKSYSTSEESETSSNKSDTEGNSSSISGSTERPTLVINATSNPVIETEAKDDEEISLTVKGSSPSKEANPESQSTT